MVRGESPNLSKTHALSVTVEGDRLVVTDLLGDVVPAPREPLEHVRLAAVGLAPVALATRQLADDHALPVEVEARSDPLDRDRAP